MVFNEQRTPQGYSFWQNFRFDVARFFMMSLRSIMIQKSRECEPKLPGSLYNWTELVVDFFSTHVGPCRGMVNSLQQISRDHPEFIFAKVDVDRFPVPSAISSHLCPSGAHQQEKSKIQDCLDGSCCRKRYYFVGKSRLVHIFV